MWRELGEGRGVLVEEREQEEEGGEEGWSGAIGGAPRWRPRSPRGRRGGKLLGRWTKV